MKVVRSKLVRSSGIVVVLPVLTEGLVGFVGRIVAVEEVLNDVDADAVEAQIEDENEVAFGPELGPGKQKGGETFKDGTGGTGG